MLSDRLKIALEAKSMKQIDLVRLLNKDNKGRVSPAAVCKWLTGKTAKIRSDLLIDTARILDVNPEWLSSGTGPATRTVEVNPQKVTGSLNIKARLIPILTYNQAGQKDKPYPATEYIYASEELPDSAYALYVEDNSMIPEFNQGDLIIIDPTIEPYPSDYVLAKLNNGIVLFQKLRYKGFKADGTPIKELFSLNPDYPIYSSETTPFEVLGKVVEHRTFLKYRRNN